MKFEDSRDADDAIADANGQVAATSAYKESKDAFGSFDDSPHDRLANWG